MTDTSERDRLVELLADRLVGDPYHPARLSAPDAEELADALIANGWSRTVRRPEVDAEVEWGVRYGDEAHQMHGPLTEKYSREQVENFPNLRRICRTVGPWQEAQ